MRLLQLGVGDASICKFESSYTLNVPFAIQVLYTSQTQSSQFWFVAETLENNEP